LSCAEKIQDKTDRTDWRILFCVGLRWSWFVLIGVGLGARIVFHLVLWLGNVFVVGLEDLFLVTALFLFKKTTTGGPGSSIWFRNGSPLVVDRGNSGLVHFLCGGSWPGQDPNRQLCWKFSHELRREKNPDASD
jgi:hypothetical protein